jgi:release factor glutamine methyltransferase
MANVASLLDLGTETLRQAEIPEPRREASSLLELAIARDRTFIIAHPDHLPDSEQTSRYHEFINRRAAREPFHYIKGVKEFYGLDLAVSPAVLIPRPETEMLVERAVGLLAVMEKPVFCEVGVGSGCISVAILVNVPRAAGVGLEISEKAIEIAAGNAVAHSVASRFDLRRSDLFNGLAADEKFDLIVSNPPYVPAAAVSGLQPEVRDHEPREALTDGGDGLSIIRRLVAGSPRFLRPGGKLMFEFGMGQAEQVREMFPSDIWSKVLIESDFQGIPRTAAGILRR